MKIKKYISTMLLGTMVLLASSCNDWLQEEPKSFIEPDQLGDSKEAVDQWVTGVYSNWLYDMFCWGEFPRVLELDADYISGPDWLLGKLGAGNFQGEQSLDKMWKGPYNLISDCNQAERYLRNMTSVDEAYINNAIGELYFQKAFAYFLLVRAYGPIPYYDNDVFNGEETRKPRTPIVEIYNHIIQLLTDASSMMYKRDDPNYKTGHVSAGSAAGLLAKVYATMASAAMPVGTQVVVKTGGPYETVSHNGEDVQIFRQPSAKMLQKTTVAGYEELNSQDLYAKAAQWAKRVIDGEFGVYELSEYSKLWKSTNRDASEFMFAIQSLDGDTKYRTQIHSFYSGYKISSGSPFIQSGGWVGCTNNWYCLFDDQDYRITDGVRHFWRYYYQEEYNGCFFYPQSWSEKVQGRTILGDWVEQDPEYAATGLAYQFNQSSECLAFTTKYDDVKNDATDYADSQWPFLRYADVILIYAEAQNELGNSEEAITYLNIVRQRSNATLLMNNPGRDALRSVIIEERAKEFACEGDRRWDLIRWGIYLDAMNSIVTNEGSTAENHQDDAGNLKLRTERNLLYPIPTAEVAANPYITENNPGWN
ncbi:MAG: RagB/SusD family nutrient uptake outer membrane protein [Prevotella sp.]|nr:RagB/SusD family nutrient uptake outer membrane protein [Prevotella sp.]